jgi:hypothetical protein
MEPDMNQAERFGVENHGRMLMELVENDPLFKDFSLVEIDVGLPNEWPAFVLVKKEADGAGIQMPEPEEPIGNDG